MAVKILLSAGAQVNARANYGRTALHMAACDHTRCDILRVLLRGGADARIRDRGGRDAEALARLNNRHLSSRILADVKAAGGSWRRYLVEPRARLMDLRMLSILARAEPHEAFSRLFAADVPPEVAWHVLSFWRTARDDEDRCVARELRKVG